MVGGGQVPDFFGAGGEKQILTFDWVDVAQGIGYVGFNLFDSRAFNGATNDITYGLFTGTLHGDQGYFEISDPSGGSSTQKIFTFSGSAFIIPQQFGEADFYLEIPMYRTTGDGALTLSGAELIKWDGTTATSLVEARGKQIDASDGRFLVKGTFPQTTFGAGDSLILELTMYCTSSSGTLNYRMGCDPSNSTLGTAPYSKSTLYIPKKIEL